MVKNILFRRKKSELKYDVGHNERKIKVTQEE